MKEDIVGRKEEMRRLSKFYKSTKSEFVTVYGRRRVGKTFLITSFFENNIFFATSGILDGHKDEQMANFVKSLRKLGYDGEKPSNWFSAFNVLEQLIENQGNHTKKVLFLDEIPCFDTPRTGFVKALGNFWNSFASMRKDILLIVCGSATSWIVNNIIDNHGGLHNRATGEIYLQPFNLDETEKFLKANHFHWNRKLVAETYMIFGGVPFYLSLLDNKQTLAANIDRLYFAETGDLHREYLRIYKSLFKTPEPYIAIIEALAKSKCGLTRNEIAFEAKIQANGKLTQMLDNLQYSGIIRNFYGKVNGKVKKRDSYYQLIDLFTLFHLTFNTKATNPTFWQDRSNTPQTNTWNGLAFERVCLWHIPQIRKTLGLNRIAVEYYSWRSNTEGAKAQIDMLIERADKLINVCEIKFAAAPYSISKREDLNMRIRMETFRQESGTRCGLIPTWITTYGLIKNEYSIDVQYQVVLDDLFEPLC